MSVTEKASAMEGKTLLRKIDDPGGQHKGRQVLKSERGGILAWNEGFEGLYY